MPDNLLDRLMAALNRNPNLFYQVWSSMRQVRFHKPWQSEGPDYVMKDLEGNLVASIQAEDRFDWEAGCQSGWCSSLAEAQQQAEAALVSEGWRLVPEEIVSEVTPWSEKETNGDRSPGYWERAHKRSGMPIARVFFEDGKWKGVVFKTSGSERRYECPPGGAYNTCEFAKHATDALLFEEGILSSAEVAPDPTLLDRT